MKTEIFVFKSTFIAILKPTIYCINIRVVYFQLLFYFFLATENSVRNREKKILTRPPPCQKILIGRYQRLKFI